MPRIAIIDAASNKVVNISEGENLPVLDEEDSEDRREYIEAHTFVFSEDAKIGDDFDGEEFTSPETEVEELTVLEQIRALEAEISPRRLREAILGKDSGWLENQEEAIDSLRGQL